MTEKFSLVHLDTGVPGLNEALAKGLPEFSFTLLAGGPGAGKTTLVHQICFALAATERPALCITVLGEPPLKFPRGNWTAYARRNADVTRYDRLSSGVVL